MPAFSNPLTIFASAARTATETSKTLVAQSSKVNGWVFVLDVTAAATEVGDTLNVHVETQLDGTNWVDVVAFTEVLGNGGAKRHVAKIMADTAQNMFSDAALAAGSVRHIMGQNYRAVATIVDAGADNASFTFSVTAIPQ